MSKPKFCARLDTNAMMVGITRRNTEFQVISECDASGGRALDDDEINCQMSFNGSMHEVYLAKNMSTRPWSPEM